MDKASSPDKKRWLRFRLFPNFTESAGELFTLSFPNPTPPMSAAIRETKFRQEIDKLGRGGQKIDPPSFRRIARCQVISGAGDSPLILSCKSFAKRIFDRKNGKKKSLHKFGKYHREAEKKGGGQI